MAEAAPDLECNAAALPSSSGSPNNGSPNAEPSETEPATHGSQHFFKPRAQQKKRAKERQRKNNSLQIDGAVSDSVVNPMAKKEPKQRQQSVALPQQAAQSAKKNVQQKQRPVSMGGNMLPATPAKEQAYAGPTFQASPAASALPMPKFFSKSVPNGAKHSASLDARMAGQKTPEHESSPEPDVVSPQPPPRSTQQSPLDLFFNAQKAENQRKVSLQSPEMKARQAPPATEPRNAFQQGGKSIFLPELDGDSDAMPSPKTVPPDNYDREAYNQSLKDLLFNGTSVPRNPNATTPPPAQRSTTHLQSPEQQFLTPSPSQRSTSGPSTPTPTNEHYSLAYGNRNLSPLFKAARGETPPRPSNLRQHSSASDSVPNRPLQSEQAQQQQGPIDPNSFSRSYLDQHIRSSQSTTMPELPGMNINGYAHQPSYQQQYPQPQQHYHPGVSAGTGASPRTTSTSSATGAGGDGRDIRSMEDDLRRMLKVNVLGN